MRSLLNNRYVSLVGTLAAVVLLLWVVANMFNIPAKAAWLQDYAGFDFATYLDNADVQATARKHSEVFGAIPALPYEKDELGLLPQDTIVPLTKVVGVERFRDASVNLIIDPYVAIEVVYEGNLYYFTTDAGGRLSFVCSANCVNPVPIVICQEVANEYFGVCSSSLGRVLGALAQLEPYLGSTVTALPKEDWPRVLSLPVWPGGPSLLDRVLFDVFLEGLPGRTELDPVFYTDQAVFN